MSKAIRRIPVLGWVGVALLTCSLGVVVWVNVRGVHAADNSGAPPKPADHLKAAAAGYAYVDVEGGTAKLYTLQPNRVVKVLVHDNDVVNQGALLIQLDDTVAKADLARAQVAFKVAEYDLEKAKFLPKEHAEKLAGETAAIAAKKDEADAARSKRAQVVRQFKEHLGPKQEDVNGVEATVRGYEEAVKIEEAKLRALQAYDPTLDVRSAEQQVKEKKALVTKAEFALRECTIKAPTKGTVLRVMVTEGDVLGPNPREPAVMFCPDGPRILRAEIEQEFASRLSLNQTVVVRDDSTNSPLFNSKVTRISDWYSHRRSMVQEPLQFNNMRTACIITLPAGEQMPLRIGQRVRVTFEAN